MAKSFEEMLDAGVIGLGDNIFASCMSLILIGIGLFGALALGTILWAATQF